MITETDSAAVYLRNEPLFDACAAPDLARLLPHVSIRTLEAGEELHSMGRSATFMYLIIDGAFSTGREEVILESGFLGEEAAIGLEFYVATAVATRSSRVLVLPAGPMQKLAQMALFRERMLASFSGRFLNGGKQHEIKHWDIAKKFLESPRIILGWMMTLLAPAAVIGYFLSTSHPLLNEQAVYFLGIISSIVMMWVFRLLPDFIPALFAVLGAILLGVAPPELALGGFASDSFFMALSILGLSAVISISGLSYRMLLWLLRVGPDSKFWYNFSLFITGAFLTPVIPTTNGRVAIMTPFLTDLLGAMDKDSAAREAPGLSMSLISGISLFSAIFLSSKSVNFVIFGMLPPQEQFLFQWLHWFYAASVCGGVLFVLYWLARLLLFRTTGNPAIPKQVVREQIHLLGSMSAIEWAGVLGLIALMASFLTSSLHRIDIPWVALAILFSLLMFGFLDQNDFRKKIDWSFLFFLGSLIGIVSIIRYVGLDIWLTANLTWIGNFMAGDFIAFVLIVAAAMFVVRLALPINATVIIFASILIPTALHIGFNPWLIGFIILLLAETFIWPYQASFYTQFISMAGPEARTDDQRVAVMHVVLFFCKLVAIYVSIPFWKSLGIL